MYYLKRIRKKITPDIDREQFGYYLRDASNLFRFGKAAPKSAQRIWINPAEVTTVIDKERVSNRFSRTYTGLVLHGDWDKKIKPIEEFPKYKICVKRFIQNKSWRESGAHELMLNRLKNNDKVDGCKNLDDIEERYNKLDELYDHLKKGGKFKTRPEIKGPDFFREKNGVYVHINRDAKPIFGGGGWHRLIISKILDLSLIPAQLGIIHMDAISKKWKKRFHVLIMLIILYSTQ